MIVIFRQLFAAALSIIIASPLCASTHDAVGNQLKGLPDGAKVRMEAVDEVPK
jgi:hypothetical protein